MLFGKEGILSPQEENQVTAVQQAAVSRLLTDGYNVIEDGTNLRKRYARRWADLAQRHGVTFKVEDILTPALICQHRNYERGFTGRGRYVDPDAISKMAAKFPIGTWPEIEATSQTLFEPYTRDPLTPKAVIFDLDGTLAHMSGRSPYDYTRVHEDAVDEDVRRILWALQEFFEVLIVSGRKADCIDLTRQWLENQSIYPRAIFMRQTGDYRDDAIVKYEIFRNHIAPNYNTVAVFDDRNRVVDMWRRIGLKCFQVQEGDF